MKKSAYILIASTGFMFFFVIVWFVLKFTTGNTIPFLNQLLWIVAGLFILVIAWFIGKAKRQVKNFKKNGIPAKATITAITNEPYKPGKMGQVKLSLQLTDRAGQPYTVECIVYGTEEDPGEFFAGKVVDVLKDPLNEKNIMLDYKLGNMSSTAMSIYTTT